MNSKDILKEVVLAADKKRAHDIVALDVKEVSLMADYFVIMDATSNRQVKSIADEIVDAVEEKDIYIKQVEGKSTAKWILIDLGEVIVHVFQSDERSFYNLEKLWSDADSVDLSDWIEE
ncbi:ribosome silencing factor [Apilactobacillus xinyiensis]|uniref:Ribosomal silencing factor RsfS n=1 Tax=Apilactobacillus xinyiensis TaxID=2841032 RepID=A0ABT0I181_9LACO|nr:ribosome silencing factor [Apilactobacillus xinyiensis]MCK8624219.1 ribosome silencing factor [Apilactobacillus xinyiensis]MCL0311811.1 ribosome silencing factor [Apilactobacillus xinyiensis]MCL0318437.1 ribosome silencing factor [Apilactobacillus xinyiensis]MCL0329496.1 ribosome silencing factor [Apilactobacillus xinyiensis]